MLIADIALFHEVAVAGSFSAVAKKRGLAPSTVSKAIERLEHKTSRLLFHRSTRALSLTAEGIDLFELTQQWIVDSFEMVQRIIVPSEVKRGLLRVNMPVFMGKRMILPIIHRLSIQHPQIKYDLTFSDRHEDVVSNGADVTIRIGELADSSLVAHKIGMQDWILCCTQHFYDSVAHNLSLQAMSSTEAIAFKMPSTGKILPWFINENDTSVQIPISNPKLKMTCGESMVEAALLSMGAAQLPHYMVRDLIQSGQLIELFPTQRPMATPVSAIISQRKFISEPVQLFLNELRQNFRI